jgi:hypothetical protein
MGELLRQFWPDIMGRVTGPLTFRLILQPLMAIFLGVRAGLRDARAGNPAFFWHLFTTKEGNRRQLIRDGWKDIGRLFILAIAMDVIYEIYVFHWVYPGQALVVAIIVALPAYLLVRGPVNRIAKHWGRKPVG